MLSTTARVTSSDSGNDGNTIFELLAPNFPLAGSGWIVGAGFGQFCNSSNATVEGTPELLYSSDFGTSLFIAVSSGVTAETKCKIHTNE